MRSQKDLNARVNLCLGLQPITGACNLAAVMLLSLVERTQPWLLAPASRAIIGLLCPFTALSFLVPSASLLLLFDHFHLCLAVLVHGLSSEFFIVSSFLLKRCYLFTTSWKISLGKPVQLTVRRIGMILQSDWVFCAALLSNVSSCITQLFKSKQEQPPIFSNFSRPSFDSSGIWESDDANPAHPLIFVTEYGLKGQSDVTLLVFLTFLIRQGILHHERRAIKVSLV